mgnify:CR=1 FL=1|jgi:hypothetical protein
MSTPDSDSSSDYGWRDSESETTSRIPTKKAIIAIVVMAIIMSSPWWVTAVPQFGFTN